jgi:hypothetical protein
MNEIFKNYLDTFFIMFLDDILMYSNLEEEHEKQLRMVFQVLSENQLYARINTRYFYQDKIHYLGHIISEDGIAVYPRNSEAIRG